MKWSEDALARRQNGRGLRCDRCDGVAVAGDPLYPQLARKYRHLRCGGKDAGASVDGRR